MWYDRKKAGVAYEHRRSWWEARPFHLLPVVHYRVWCLERLRLAFSALPDRAKTRVRAILEDHDCWEPFHMPTILPSNLHLQGGHPAEGRPVPKMGVLEYLRRYFTGTHWHKPHGAG